MANNKIQMPKPLTPEEKRQQVMRLMAQKYESIFTGLLMNMSQNPAFDPLSEGQGALLVENARKMTDLVMDSLYKPKDETQAANWS